MRLDRTKIAIRERSLFDLLDMALRVLFVYLGPILLCAVVVAVPMMLVNWWLIGWMTEYGDITEGSFRYFWTMILLVAIEAPLISMFVTPYLGQVMFQDEINPREVIQATWSSKFQLVMSHLVFRGIGAALYVAWSIPADDEFSMPEFWLMVLALFALILRAARPFNNEIILLEKNPFRSKDPNVISAGKRSQTLHGPNSGDLISRWLGCVLIAVLLVISILGTIWFMWGMLSFDWNWGPVMYHFCFPLTLWIIATYFSIVRFLSYLDLRIRREGWEVELVMRAAAARMAESIL